MGSLETSFQCQENGYWYPYFSHDFNCGRIGTQRTERTVELALSNYWLDRVDDVYEVGAVTPYYWDSRVSVVIDPSDNHPQVTSHASLFEHDFIGKNVLSISTIEHVGKGEYGITENRTAVEALQKIVTESNYCLITVPLGWNNVLDEYLLKNESNELDCTIRFLTRTPTDTWIPSKKENAYIQYGGGGHLSAWANSIAILEKGEILS